MQILLVNMTLSTEAALRERESGELSEFICGPAHVGEWMMIYEWG